MFGCSVHVANPDIFPDGLRVSPGLVCLERTSYTRIEGSIIGDLCISLFIL